MKTLLITMPWGQPVEPAYLMGKIHGLLEKTSITNVKSFSYFLEFANYIAECKKRDNTPFSLSDYQEFIGNFGLGEWVFAAPPIREYSTEMDIKYFDYLKRNGVAESVIEHAVSIRKYAQTFLAKCLKEIISEDPNIVIFLPMYRECIPSLSLAKLIKDFNPSIKIVFSGPVCDGPVGAGLLKNFLWIDYVIRDFPEIQIPALIGHLAMSTDEFSHPGVCSRNGTKEGVAFDQMPDNISISDDISIPIYDEYFQRLENSIINPLVSRELWISYYASVGCWWAEKNKCSFCALCGTKKNFISKKPETVINEILLLAEKHKQLQFQMFDWIIDPDYISTLYKMIGKTGVDLTLYLQTRSHLSKDDLLVLKAAGAALQVGVESLSDNILRLMKKGTSTLQNIRILKWCAELDIKADWNILYNFPGESAFEYDKMTEVAKSLVHFAPPRMNRFRLHPLSPYFENPKQFSIEIDGPKLWYFYVFSSLPANELSNIAEEFEFHPNEGQKVEVSASIGRLQKIIDEWVYYSNNNYCQLFYKNGPGFMQIIDKRIGIGPARYTLDELEASIYKFCDGGRSLNEIQSFLVDKGWGSSLDEIKEFLDNLVHDRLMYREGNHYLSLAIHQS